jgi:hypothetical protein
MALPCTNTTTKWWWEWNLVFSENGIHPTGYFSRENFDMPIRSWGAILSDKPTLWLGFSGAMFHAIPRCYWMFLAESTYDFPTVSVALPHPAQSSEAFGPCDLPSRSPTATGAGWNLWLLDSTRVLDTWWPVERAWHPGWHKPCMSTLIQGRWGSWCCTLTWWFRGIRKRDSWALKSASSKRWG